MNMGAVSELLKALQKNCYDDMADEKSSPEEKMAAAVEDTSDDLTDLDVDDDEDMADMGDDMKAEPDEEDPIRSTLKEFMRNKPPIPPRPGTAVMIAMDEKKPSKKKSLKDMMNG